MMVGVETLRAEDVPPGRAPMGFWIAKTVSPQWEGLVLGSGLLGLRPWRYDPRLTGV